MRRCTSVGVQSTAAYAMARLGASWLAHNGLRRVVMGGALPPTRAQRRRIHFKPAPCAPTLRPMRRCASVVVLLTAACAMARLEASWRAHKGLRRVGVGGATPPPCTRSGPLFCNGGGDVSFHGYKQAPEGVLKVLLPNGTLSVLSIGTRWRQGWGDTLMGRHLPPPRKRGG